MRVRLSIVRRNSFSNVSEMICPVLASTDAWPETKTNPPALMAGENGKWLVGTSGPRTTSMGIGVLRKRFEAAKVDQVPDGGNEREASPHPHRARRGRCDGHRARRWTSHFPADTAAARVRRQLLVRPAAEVHDDRALPADQGS